MFDELREIIIDFCLLERKVICVCVCVSPCALAMGGEMCV